MFYNSESAAQQWLSQQSGQPVPALVFDGKKHRIGRKSAKGSPVYWAHKKRDTAGREYHTVTYSTFAGGGYSATFSDYDAVVDADADDNVIDHIADIRRRAKDKERQSQQQARKAEQERRAALAAAKEQADEKRRAEKLAEYLHQLTYLQRNTERQSEYFARKALSPSMIRGYRFNQSGGFGLVPLYNEVGSNPLAVQLLFDSGDKLIYGTAKGAFAVIGALPVSGGRVAVVEGIATGLSVFLSGEMTVICAMSAGNILPVIRQLKRQFKGMEIIVYADNDAHKPDVGNTGLHKAFEAALKTGSKVKVPDFTGLTESHKHTDFDDMRKVFGVNAIAALPFAPIDFNLAHGASTKHHDARRKNEAFIHGMFTGMHKTEFNSEKLPDIEIGEGVTFIRAGMGSGKTYQAFRNCADRKTESSVYISHLVSLAESAAAKDNRELYSDYKPAALAEFPHISICLNSLPKLVLNGKTKQFDTVILDEVEQVLRRLTSRDIENKAAVIDVLRFLIRSARRVVVLDAHISPLAVDFVKSCRADGEVMNAVINWYDAGSNRNMRHYQSRDDLERFIYQSIGDGRRGYIAMNSKRRALGLFTELQSRFPGKRGLYISADNAGDSGVRAFFADVNGQAAQYAYIVATPSVSTGVSIDVLPGGNPAFDFVAGIFRHDVNLPGDCLQAINRVRGSSDVHLFISRNTVAAGRSADEVSAKWLCSLEYDSGLIGLDHAGRVVFRNAVYEAIAGRVAVAESIGKASFFHQFTRLAYCEGYQQVEVIRADVEAETMPKLSRIAQEEKARRILAAQDIDEATAEKLKRKNRKTFAETMELERHETKAFFGVTDDNELPEILSMDTNGKLRQAVRRLELCSADDAELQRRAMADSKAGTLAADLNLRGIQREFYRALLECVGVDSVTLQMIGDGTYSEADMAALGAFIELHRAEFSGVFRVPAKVTRRFVGDSLRKLGIRQERIGKNESGIYAVNSGSLEFMRNMLDRRKALRHAESAALAK